MADIVRREEWSPFKMMRAMLRNDPFQEMSKSFWQGREFGDFAPTFDIKETKQGFVFRGDLPGLADKDVKVEIRDRVLTISGQREEEKRDEGEKYYAYERSYGSFARSFALPDNADTEHATAEMKDGVLTVAMPKTAGGGAREIAVKTGGRKS